MIIETIKAANYRSFKLFNLHLNPGLNLFYGENGAGKSTILESIQQNLTGKSFRSNNIDQIIQKGYKKFQVKTIFQGNSFVSSQKTENNKLIYQSSTNNSPTIKEILLEFPSCMLESTDFFFNTAEPEKKRNYLNKVLFYVEHSYTDTLKELKKVHKQRNYALKRGLKDEIKLWSNRLCDIEPSITELNQAIIEKLNTKLANSKLTELFYNKNRWIGGIFLKYDNGFDNKKSLNQVLHDGLPLDMLLKRTNYGPHKRKFTIHNKEDNISTFLSRGQQKLLSIILHVLQKEIIDEHTNKSSLLLLDDISSELDSDNLKLMLKYLEENTQQTLMTSITNTVFTEFKNITMFHVEQSEGVSNVR